MTGWRKTLSVIAGLAVGGPLAAQPPAEPLPRTPAYGPDAPATSYPPAIPSFPAPAGPTTLAPQTYQPPRPGLSPYLNLTRGNRGSGIGAVDYYNFVRPAQQSLGSYVGRQPGPYNPANRYGGIGLDPDIQLDPNTSLRPAGTPSAFMNHGRYFNSMGTIGLGIRPQQQQQQHAPTTGRR